MNRSTLAALIVALMLGSGITGYLIGKPGDSVDQIPPAPRTAVAAPPAAAPATTPPAAPAPPRPPPPPPAPGTIDGAHPRRPPGGRPQRSLRLSPCRHRQQPAR